MISATVLAANEEAALRRPTLPSATNADIRPNLLWRILLKGVDPKLRLKGFAPRVLQPAPHLDPASTHARFLASHQFLRGLVDQCGNVDVNRLRFPHPALGLPISAGETFLLLALHGRHLHQAESAVHTSS